MNPQGKDDIRSIPGVKRYSSFLLDYSSRYASSLGIINQTYFITIEKNQAVGGPKPKWNIFFVKELPALKKGEWYAAGVCKVNNNYDRTIFGIIFDDVKTEYVKANRAWKIYPATSEIIEIGEEVICDNESYGLP